MEFEFFGRDFFHSEDRKLEARSCAVPRASGNEHTSRDFIIIVLSRGRRVSHEKQRSKVVVTALTSPGVAVLQRGNYKQRRCYATKLG